MTLLLLLAVAVPLGLSAEDTNAPVASAGSTGTDDATRAYLQLQEDVHSTRLAVESNRAEAELAATRTADEVRSLEQSISQRTARLEGMQSSNQLILAFLISISGAGLLVLGLTVFFQSRAVRRLEEISAALPSAAAVWPVMRSMGAFDAAAREALAGPEHATARLLATIDRLERRIAELERVGRRTLNDHPDADTPASAPPPEPEPADQSGNGATPADQAPLIAELLGKGQRLLDANDAAGALAVFDEALALEPNHAEALVKKGVALEQMRQTAEAIDCYDRAIAADDSLTIAYLHKAGLCHRLERFNEAMECYEQALRTQERGRAV
jgi:tetratricopeptide (TPR) repeat protein